MNAIMSVASQRIKTKFRTFFAHFNDASRRNLYGVLTLELDNLSTETSQLASTDNIAAQLHKYKGVCRYLQINNEAIYSDETSKAELLESITTLQTLLKDIESEM